jgi:recombinational DNA repair protein (RecF pathway)
MPNYNDFRNTCIKILGQEHIERIDKSIKIFISLGLNPSLCTCGNCANSVDCEFAFDIYNYDGDCIMEK